MFTIILVVAALWFIDYKFNSGKVLNEIKNLFNK